MPSVVDGIIWTVPTITCGWCKDRCHMSLSGKPQVTPLGYNFGRPEYVADAAFTCDGCRRMSVVTWWTKLDPQDPKWSRAGAKAKGIVNGRLFDKIEAMADQGLIRAAVKDQAHEIRHFGNGSAHGDLDDDVNKEDAAEVLNLMGEVINEVWQSPARAARLAAQRAARRSQVTP